ncbi:cation acetate symporter [Nocardia asteroides NBRC 15531]|uniref:SSS family transporter n=1 Tax=Nocardia asteroides NBRC 15531 TaxID=1110697 RepID=U5E7D2_NOCAS|nr:cation acetate symporter [Nocardia asteroides]TLF61934.1 cation acetate symporter [Nocardia asteroides NBRC 15531]UGT46640.1 cation acetate symporter [Nocardia asteroides]SFN86181.1 Sodium:solute symporter family protein [Nocardia asteroides]VEG34524.1 Acetate transporter ActP [Nocardia asteroides]GAD83170.1 SSS family transporter [Nocardia asteroides NBRC 15531]
MTPDSPALTIAALLLAAVATIGIGFYGVRLSRTTSDFLVASRTVGSRWNAAAISGEYLSAASFLGVAGLIAKYGADALWYPVGFTAGYLGLLMFVAAPLRRSGAYTVPDFAEFRLGSIRLRRLAAGLVVLVCAVYLIPQFQGAGLTLHILLGAPPWVGAVAVGAIVLANVIGGGMRSVTLVQAFQYWLKLTAVAVPALVLGLHFLGDEPPLGSPAPPTVDQRTTVDISTDVVVHLDVAQQVHVTGTVDGAAARGPVLLTPGDHTLTAGTELVLEPGAAVPVVAGAPADGASWVAAGGGFGGEHPQYQVFSLIVATFLGTMGLPHVLVRFYTNRDGPSARRTALTVIGLVGLFYLFPILLGVFARLYVPQLLITGASDAAVVLLPGAVLGGLGGQLLAALAAAGAIAAFLSTSSGLLVSLAGVLSTDVLRGRIRDFRAAALVAGLVPLTLALTVASLDLSRTVALAFSVAASTLCPLLVLGIWWRGLTAAGAAAGLLTGGVTAGGATVLAVLGGVSPELADGWASAIVDYPGAVSVPLAFAVTILVSLLTRGQDARTVAGIFVRMHAPERLGLSADRDPESTAHR